jgi:signal transduction histidine kinase
MKRITSLFLALMFGLFAGQYALAASDRGTPAEAEAMVKKAVAYVKAHGKDKAFAEFMNKKGPFIDRDLYITVYDFQGNNLAHINPKMVGKNMMELRDPDGKAHIRERIEMARAHGKGWHDFKFLNPVSKQIEPKSMYFEKHDDIVVACGFYKP